MKATDFKKEINSINGIYTMLSNIYLFHAFAVKARKYFIKLCIFFSADMFSRAMSSYIQNHFPFE